MCVIAGVKGSLIACYIISAAGRCVRLCKDLLIFLPEACRTQPDWWTHNKTLSIQQSHTLLYASLCSQTHARLILIAGRACSLQVYERASGRHDQRHMVQSSTLNVLCL